MSAQRKRRSAGSVTIATSRWWQEERYGVFLDYDQNARAEPLEIIDIGRVDHVSPTRA